MGPETAIRAGKHRSAMPCASGEDFDEPGGRDPAHPKGRTLPDSGRRRQSSADRQVRFRLPPGLKTGIIPVPWVPVSDHWYNKTSKGQIGLAAIFYLFLL